MYETALSSLNCLFINYDNLVMGRLSYPCPRVIFLLLLPFSSPPTDLHGKTLEEALWICIFGPRMGAQLPLPMIWGLGCVFHMQGQVKKATQHFS